MDNAVIALPNHKVAGVDRIHNEILKGHGLGHPRHPHGAIPNIGLETARIIPIHKPASYRPVALTSSALTNLLEKLVSARLRHSRLEDHNQLSDSQ